MMPLKTMTARIGKGNVIFMAALLLCFCITLSKTLFLENELIQHFDYVGGKLQWAPRSGEAVPANGDLRRSYQFWMEITLAGGVLTFCQFMVILQKLFRGRTLPGEQTKVPPISNDPPIVHD